MSNDNIKIRVIQPEDSEQVVNFIVEHFYRDEPLCATEPKIVASQTDIDDILECIRAGTSIMATKELSHGEEELLAVNIAAPKDATCIEKYFKTAEKAGNTKYGQILKLLAIANRNADIFQRYNVSTIFYSFITCVKPSARGHNLGKRLKLEIMALGKTLGYQVLAADCTSFYSAGVCERLGMDRVHFIAYQDYVDENNRPIFNPPSPHVGLSSFAIRL
ncbi:arylalkylamine N-acetyltransferase 1-like [Lucilia cuprina]|uniref:arylalkylamine N-acetyltransferase 1-like n=1 Tax=Lucilia cuprina TaxID=7375 RepID=UPI001F06DD27|nr:arylalkylamine N-acetyltransferase 1-like [Lucilia cuprina]